MRKLLMIAAFAAFTACASQSDTDVGETTPQTDEGAVQPEDQNPPTTEEAPPPSTGYEPQPGATDTTVTPPGDTAATERAIPDTLGADTGAVVDTSTAVPPTTPPPTTGTDTSTTGTWGDTSSTPPPPTTTDTLMTTAPDSL